MSKIIFLKDTSNIYDCYFYQIGEHQIRLVFNNCVPTEDIILSGFHIVNEHNGYIQTKREGYNYIYRLYEDNKNIVELCDDNIKWEKPNIIVTFNADFGGIINGNATQIVENYESLEIPAVVANDNYKFIGWYPEIPQNGVIESNKNFTAKFEYIKTLDEVRIEKITEFNNICNTTITIGQDIKISTGETIHFDYTDHNQKNLRDAADIAKVTKERVPYYDSNNKCYLFEAIDAINIYANCMSYVNYLITLDHHLETMIKKMNNKDDIVALQFSETSLDEETKADFDIIINQAKIVADKYMQNISAELNL